MRRFGEWLARHRWFISVFLAALAVRLHWNLHVHPLGDYIYSDMAGYLQRADRLLRNPQDRYEYAVFFPFGTHVLLAGIKALFGIDNYRAVGAVYALMGAGTAAFGYAVAARVARFRFVAPAVGFVGIFYYPQFALGGYILSEPPFAFFLMAAMLSAVRLADEGKHRDAWGLGLWAGLGAWIRPQMLLSAAFVGIYWLVRRRALSQVRWVHMLQAAVPLALTLGLSAAHFHYHTGRRGLVSENGSFNLVFGRCHNGKIESLPDGKGHGHVHFRPPPLLQVEAHVQKARERGEVPKIDLRPAIGETISYRGYIGDREKHMEFIRKCVQVTGIWGQIEYGWTNVVLLWRHNTPWPDSGRATWRKPAKWWTHQHRIWFAIPGLVGIVFMFLPGTRNAKLGLLSVNALALVVTSAIYFGGTRHREPYDLISIALAFEVYGLVLLFLWQRWFRKLTQARSPAASRRIDDLLRTDDHRTAPPTP